MKKMIMEKIISLVNKIYKINDNLEQLEIVQLKSTINHNIKVLLSNKKVLNFKKKIMSIIVMNHFNFNLIINFIFFNNNKILKK